MHTGSIWAYVTRIEFWVSALCIACAPAVPPRADAPPLTAASEIDVAWDNDRQRIRVKRDDTVDSQAVSQAVEVIARRGAAVVLIDTYASRSSGMSLCQAGEERFLRVITRGDVRARETWSMKLESCHENIELASPGYDWDAASGTLQLQWLQRGNADLPLQAWLTVAPDGQVSEL